MFGNIVRLLRDGLLLLLALAIGVAECSDAFAQQFELASESQLDREQLYAELSRDVDALDRELSIYKRVVRLVAPSVVHIESTPLPKHRFRRDVEEAGSGILVRYQGKDYVLTNRHVIKHSQEDLIRLELADGQELQPTRIWSDSDTDVAVMAVAANGLIPARFGDSDSTEVGDVVMAFGSPFNLRQSVTRGIISAKGRSNLDLGDGEVNYQKFIQTDAAINPGNSGGPLVNLRGEVIGLNTAIASNSGGNEGIGFSIPINIVVRIMRQLIETGTVEAGFMGVHLDASFDSASARYLGMTRLRGTRITQINEHSPAAKANLQVDDVILRFDGMQVEDMDHLINLVKRTEVNRQIEMLIFREKQLQKSYVSIGRMENDIAPVDESP
ncbi:MAG: trypsin-like peptidase domain-containing protein [Planctomycetes bacterium]|nr:trypsin-like peptidase domain-containing protein [Planctomycetota bacterium]